MYYFVFLFYRVIANMTIFLCCPPNWPSDQTAVDKYQVKNILLNPEVPEKSASLNIKKKSLKLKMSFD